jgi:tRNA 2-thiouridine synthesizing protein C
MGITKVLVIFTKAPYTSTSIVEGVRLATGVTAADVASMALFIDDGIMALVKGQDPDQIGLASAEKSLEFLAVNDIPLRVVSESLRERGIAESDLLTLPSLEVISLEQVAALIPQFDACFTI